MDLEEQLDKLTPEQRNALGQMLILRHEVRVNSVNIEGLRSINSDIIIPFLKPLLKSQSLEELIKASANAKGQLSSIDAFSYISINIAKHAKDADLNQVNVTVSVKENRKVGFGVFINSDVNSADGSCNGYTTLRNLFGRLESLTFRYSKGSSKLTGCDLTFNKPLFPQTNSHVQASLSSSENFSRTAGFHSNDMVGEVQYQVGGFGGLNKFKVAALWQQIYGAGNAVPVKLREEYGHHTKFSAHHTYTRDTRDDILTPTRGSRFSLSTELAGFLGDSNHLKVDADVSKTTRLPFGLSSTVTARAGFIRPLVEGSRVSITDRFYCGGPGSIRGFFSDGIGPKADTKPLGGLFHWGLGLSLHRQLPFKPYIWGLGKFMRLHSFVNTGALESEPASLFRNPRLSVGSGLIIKVADRFKMEINYAVPLRHQPTDVVNQGLQFGIGLNFL